MKTLQKEVKMNYKEYMKKTGVTKKAYVQKWLDADLIPGVIDKDDIDIAEFPESARRPYANRWLTAKTDANVVRGHVVKAAISKHHISAKQCFMSTLEFNDMIAELVRADLIRERVEDDITYYDSTLKSATFTGKSMAELRRFVIDAIEAASRGAVTGMCEAA